ncbi:ATP-dependent DNA/RNA helicase dhx36, partial [Entophlyctis sp. JEL0112]
KAAMEKDRLGRKHTELERERLRKQADLEEKTRLEALLQETPPPPAPKSPYFPANFELDKKAFLDYYVRRFGLSAPTEKTEEVIVQGKFKKGKGKGKGKATSSKWIARLSLPAHRLNSTSTTLSPNSESEIVESTNADVAAIHIKAAANTRKEALLRATKLFTEHLLASINRQILEEFVEFATPIKVKVQQMISKPAIISIESSLLDAAEKLIAELTSRSAFQLTSAARSDQSMQSNFGLGRQKHVSIVFPRVHRNSSKIDPRSIATPSELDRAKDLPIYNYYADIMAAIDNNSVTIISAATGAGKTTQLPSFILAYHKWKNETFPDSNPIPPNVIVTQPRRIAATSVAQRIAKERNETIGKDSAIGYNVRFLSVPPRGRIGNGQVGKLIDDDPNLESVTHIILDEVHERDLSTDLLLIIVRNLIERRPDIKIILMSATADTALFANYFKRKPSLQISFSSPPSVPDLPPIISVPGRLFPVKEFHLEEVMDLLNSQSRLSFQSMTQKFIDSELSGGYKSNTRVVDYFPVELYESMLTYIVKMRGPGAILVFLPGWQEISLLMQQLQKDRSNLGFSDTNKVKIFALHSSVSSAGQDEVFERPKPGVRKIILATNIAETSVTINDVVFVVDSAKMRVNTYDPNSRTSSLACIDAAQSNLKQRSGRAGRCQPGEYYCLISRRHRETLQFNMKPELLRVDLQSTALKIKSLNLSPFTSEVLAQAPEPPASSSVQKAIEDLHMLGALTSAQKSVDLQWPSKSRRQLFSDFMDVEALTPLGKCLSNVPMDPWLAKLVVMAAAFRALDPILTAACVLESGNRGVYAIHPDEREKARKHILENFAIGQNGESSNSDLLTMVNAYNAWRARGKDRDRREYALNNHLSHTNLLNVDRGKEQVSRVLKDVGVVQDSRNANFDEFSDNSNLVRSLICGALFPNIAEVRERNIYGTPLDGRLKLTGSTVNSHGPLQAIADRLKSLPAKPSPSSGPIQESKQSEESDVIECALDDPDTTETAQDVALPSTGFSPPVLPPRFLSYHEKQMLDGAVWMRSTTLAEPLGMILFSSFGDTESRLKWTFDPVDQKWIAIMGGWMRVEFSDARTKSIVEDLRTWMDRYLEFVVSGRLNRSSYKDQVLSQRLVELVSQLMR